MYKTRTATRARRGVRSCAVIAIILIVVIAIILIVVIAIILIVVLAIRLIVVMMRVACPLILS